MAVQLPSGLYSGFTEVLDSRPTMNMVNQNRLRKQAQDDAVDEYYRKLPSTLNSAGMRDQSIAGFNQAVGEWQKYWMENKDSIRKGTTPEAFNSDKMLREIQQKINEDKNAAKTDLELGKMRLSKENGYIFDDPEFIKTQSVHSLPIWDANHKSIDLGTIAIPPRPFDMESQDKLWTSVTKGLSAGKNYNYDKKYENKETGQVIVPFQKNYSPEQVKKIADQTAAIVKNDKSAIAHYNKILNSETSEVFDKLQEAYSKHYEGIVDTPEKAAAAEAIIRATAPQEVGEEQESNYGQKKADRITIMNVQDKLIRGRKSIGDSGVEFGDYDILGKYEGKIKKKTVRGNKISGGIFPKYEEIEIEIIPAQDVDKAHQDMIGVSPITDEKDGTKYYIKRSSGDWEGKNGQVISATVIAQKELDKVNLNELRRGRQSMNLNNSSPSGSNQNSGGGTKKKVYQGLDKNGNPIYK